MIEVLQQGIEISRSRASVAVHESEPAFGRTVKKHKSSAAFGFDKAAHLVNGPHRCKFLASAILFPDDDARIGHVVHTLTHQGRGLSQHRQDKGAGVDPREAHRGEVARRPASCAAFLASLPGYSVGKLLCDHKC